MPRTPQSRDRPQVRVPVPSAGTKRRGLSVRPNLSLWLGTVLAQLILLVACGSPAGSGNGQPQAGPPAGQLAADPTSLSFGTVPIGSSSSQTVTVTARVATVTISQAAVTGDAFSVTSPTLPTTLLAGQSAWLAVEFTPSASGGVTGSVSLVSNAANSPPTIAVSGIGADVATPPSPPPPPPLSVALSWDASTSGDVIGYYVYRGTRSGGPYARLVPFPIPTTTYNDSSVKGGIYYYVVTAVDRHGVESSYSNQARATLTNP